MASPSHKPTASTPAASDVAAANGLTRTRSNGGHDATVKGQKRPAAGLVKNGSVAFFTRQKSSRTLRDRRPGIQGTNSTFPIDKSTNLNRAISYTVNEWPSHDESSSSSSSSSEDEGEKGMKSRRSRKETQRKKMPGLRQPETIDPARFDKDRVYSAFAIGNDKFHTKGRVSRRDGRLRLSINEFASGGYLSNTLGENLRQHILLEDKGREPPVQFYTHEITQVEEKLEGSTVSRKINIPKLNIVVIVIGSRGDIQPFVKIGKILKEQYGHRVRLATHPAFKDFIEKEAKLEFFSVGGNPSELMAFMVKNPGLIPTMETVTSGEVGRRRAAMYEMFLGMWRACISTTDQTADMPNVKTPAEQRPFVADAIIANPPSFAHVHLAERLGVPLHLM